jgi:hypothetical protein
VKGIGRRTKLLPGSTFMTAPVQLSSPQTLIQMQGKAGTGQYEILARGSSPSPELIGLAKRGDDGRVIPVMVMKATPGFSYAIRPMPAYHVCVVPRPMQVGQIVDLRAVRPKVLVDFASDAAKDALNANLTLTPQGFLDVQFSGPSLDADIGFDTGGPGLLRHRKGLWRGSVTYPSTASTASIIQATGLLLDRIGAKYVWSVTTSQNQLGGVTTQVRFCLKDPAEKQHDWVYQEDWQVAVSAGKIQEGKDDEQLDLGCFPGTPCGSYTCLSIAAR